MSTYYSYVPFLSQAIFLTLSDYFQPMRHLMGLYFHRTMKIFREWCRVRILGDKFSKDESVIFPSTCRCREDRPLRPSHWILRDENASLMGIKKFRPVVDWPKNIALDVIPTTFPFESNKGPPLLPGKTFTSLCMYL